MLDSRYQVGAAEGPPREWKTKLLSRNSDLTYKELENPADFIEHLDLPVLEWFLDVSIK